MRRKTKGFSLASTLLLLLVLSTLVLVVAGAGTSHINLIKRSNNSIAARHAAESLVALAIANIQENPDFGQSGETLEWKPERVQKAEAVLTFDPLKAEEMGLLESVNNLDNDSAVPGSDGQVVPGASVRLLARGRYRGAERTVEAIYRIPRYPYVIASNGTFTSNGNLFVAGVANVAEIDKDEPEYIGGDLVTNSSVNSSILLGPNSEILGDLQSTGGIEVAESSSVRGEIRSFSEVTEIPKVDLRLFDPEIGNKPDVQFLTSGYLRDPVFEGYLKKEGNLSLAGQVKLDGAVLFVDGDLSVGGSLVGKGAVIVTGTTTITGSATLATDNMAAILSAGEVNILGQGDERSTFRGMVYTESNFTARNLSLYGTFIANGGADSVVSIQDSRLIHVPDYAEVSFTPKQSSSDGITSDMTFYFQTEGEYHGYHEPKRGRHLRIRVVREQDGSYTAYDLQDGDSDNQPDTSTILPSIADALEDHIEEDEMEEFYETSGPFVDILRQMPRTGGGTSPGDGDENKFPSPEPSFEFDPMEFLKPEERIRLVLWRLR